jgi:sulfhydrogenase subunit beta (sulfur reductase)
MNKLTTRQLISLLESLEAEWDIRLPVNLPDGTRALGPMKEGPPALLGGPLPAKPTSAFFPQDDPLFTAAGDDIRLPQLPERPLLVLGFTARDLECLRFIDRFFANHPRDDIYFRRREAALVVAVTGWCGPGNTFMNMARGGCDLELLRDEEIWFLLPYTEKGRSITPPPPSEPDDSRVEQLREVSRRSTTNEELLLRQAATLVRDGKIPDSFWQEIGDRCILCTGCNLVCPTCTCFGIRDWRSAAQVERNRLWDSCQLEGFMREAGGHNPLGTEALRTRRRIHHKLAADLERWGEISCFLCGRCDAACPTGIGIMAVMAEMVARYGDSIIRIRRT